jgi:hypothetical protein
MRSVGEAERNEAQRRDSSVRFLDMRASAVSQGMNRLLGAQSNVTKLRRPLVRRTPKLPVTLGRSEG